MSTTDLSSSGVSRVAGTAHRDGAPAGVFGKLPCARQPVLSAGAQCHVGSGVRQRNG
jgi:hypothetical protein